MTDARQSGIHGAPYGTTFKTRMAKRTAKRSGQSKEAKDNFR